MIAMEFLSRHKITILLAIVVAGAAWWGLSSFSSSSSSPSSLLTTEGVDSTLSPQDQTLVATLLQLRSVTLDSAIFSEPSFTALQDFSTPIVAEPVGRPDPFAPLTSPADLSASSTHAAAIFTPAQ